MLQFCNFTKNYTADSIVELTSPCLNASLPTKPVVIKHRFLKQTDEGIFLYIMDDTLLYEYSLDILGNIKNEHVFKHISICDLESKINISKYKNFLLFHCIGTQQNDPVDNLILFLRTNDNTDKNGYINPSQLETFYNVYLPRARIIELFQDDAAKDTMLISHPEFFLVQYDISPNSFVNFTASQTTNQDTTLSLRLSNLFSSSIFLIEVHANQLWFYVRLLDFVLQQYSLQVVLVIYLIAVAVIYKALISRKRSLERQKIRSIDNKEAEMKYYLENRLIEPHFSAQLLA